MAETQVHRHHGRMASTSSSQLPRIASVGGQCVTVRLRMTSLVVPTGRANTVSLRSTTQQEVINHLGASQVCASGLPTDLFVSRSSSGLIPPSFNVPPISARIGKVAPESALSTNATNGLTRTLHALAISERRRLARAISCPSSLIGVTSLLAHYPSATAIGARAMARIYGGFPPITRRAVGIT